MRGEKIYEYEVDFITMFDFGVAFSEIQEGKASIPVVGARFDAGFAGRSRGRLAGQVSGIDYAYLRPDGCLQLDIRGIFETDDGHRISLKAGGVGVLRPDAPVLELSENVNLLTASEVYAWVNARQIWAFGTADLTAGKIFLEGFMQ
jgi:hypothetical protein